MVNTIRQDDNLIEALFWIVVIILVRGWVLFNMWSWFMVPLGAPVIGFLHMAGIAEMVNIAAGGAKSGGEGARSMAVAVLTRIALLLFSNLIALCIWILINLGH